MQSSEIQEIQHHSIVFAYLQTKFSYHDSGIQSEKVLKTTWVFGVKLNLGVWRRLDKAREAAALGLGAGWRSAGASQAGD